jgi:hypothetical protein
MQTPTRTANIECPGAPARIMPRKPICCRTIYKFFGGTYAQLERINWQVMHHRALGEVKTVSSSVGRALELDVFATQVVGVKDAMGQIISHSEFHVLDKVYHDFDVIYICNPRH